MTDGASETQTIGNPSGLADSMVLKARSGYGKSCKHPTSMFGAASLNVGTLKGEVMSLWKPSLEEILKFNSRKQMVRWNQG